jgi:integrase
VVNGRRRYLSGRTRSEVTSKLRDARGARERGELTARRPPTVEQWLAVWLRDIAPSGNGERSLDLHADIIRIWLVPHLGGIRLDKLAPEDIRKMFRAVVEAGRSQGRLGSIRRTLNRALKAAVAEGKTPRNVLEVVDTPRAWSGKHKALTRPDARAVLVAARQLERNGARYVVALALGLRQGEALGLSWDNVDLEEGVVTIAASNAVRTGRHGCGPRRADGAWPCGRRFAKHCSNPERIAGIYRKDTKTRAGERTIALPAPLIDELRTHRRAQLAERMAHPAWVGWHVNLVFAQPSGRPIWPSHDNRIWHALLDAAGVPTARLHDARHTAATVLLELGVDLKVVSVMLGHANPGITQQIYQGVTAEMSQLAADEMAGALWTDGERQRGS